MKLINKNNFLHNLYKIFFITFLCIIINYIVYIGGGTGGSWAQLNYIVIILSAYYFRFRGSLIVSTIVGLIMGPFMPLDRFNAIMQTPFNWVLRLSMYVFVGLLVAYALKKNDKYQSIIKDNYLKSHINGLYNSNKLFLDLNSLNKQDIQYHLACIKITNLEEISKYYDFNIINIITDFVVKQIEKIDTIFSIYSISQSELIVIIKENNISNIINNLNIFLDKFIQPITVNDYNFKLIIKIGILKRDKNKDYNAIDTFNKVRIATDQGDLLDAGLYTYDNNFAIERKLYNEIANSLYQAIVNDNLYLVYQPIIDIKENIISSCEILVRWDRGDKPPIGPNVFIKIAEDIGIIQLITKWVAEHALRNYKIWAKQGCNIKQSINITARELLDDHFRQWATNLFIKYDENCRNFGLEITERVLSKDNSKLNRVLYNLKKKGYLIEIDDFGTGYNSLMFLGEIPSDVIKIDKYFIDKIYNEDMQIIIKKIIEAVHNAGSIVIAEGVEDKKQYQILKDIGCDKIQGYYFSKPLTSKKFIEYYKSFDINNY